MNHRGRSSGSLLDLTSTQRHLRADSKPDRVAGHAGHPVSGPVIPGRGHRYQPITATPVPYKTCRFAGQQAG